MLDTLQVEVYNSYIEYRILKIGRERGSHITQPAKPPLIGHQTLQQAVTEALRGMICDAVFQPGERLQQGELAARLGVSTMPVREALRQLDVEGLVEFHTRRGARVVDIRVEELEEVYLIRSQLEGLAIQLGVPRLTEPEVEELEEILELMSDAVTSRDRPALLRLNRTFHFVIYEAASSPLLLTLLRNLWNRCSIYRQAYVQSEERARKSHQEHAELLQACKARDAHRAEQIMRVHVERTASALRGQIHANYE